MMDDHGLMVDADSLAGPVRTRGAGAVRTLVLILAWLAFVGAGRVLVPGTALAQETGSLDEVESLMAEGRIIQAREVLEVWLDSRYPSASRDDRQRGIWLRGKLTVDPSMAEVDFRRLVLETLRGVPFGETISYGALAERIGHPGAARAVGGALAANPVPLLVPCHRVLKSGGEIGGFSAPGGPAMKQRLLRHEGITI